MASAKDGKREEIDRMPLPGGWLPRIIEHIYILVFFQTMHVTFLYRPFHATIQFILLIHHFILTPKPSPNHTYYQQPITWFQKSLKSTHLPVLHQHLTKQHLNLGKRPCVIIFIAQPFWAKLWTCSSLCLPSLILLPAFCYRPRANVRSVDNVKTGKCVKWHGRKFL